MSYSTPPLARPITPRQRAAVLAFVAGVPDTTLGKVARGCHETRGDASATLDALIQDGLVRVRHPWLVRLGGPILALLVGAERYSLTEAGVWALSGPPK